MIRATAYWEAEGIEPSVYLFKYGIKGVKKNGKRPIKIIVESFGDDKDTVSPEAFASFLKNCRMVTHPCKGEVIIKL